MQGTTPKVVMICCTKPRQAAFAGGAPITCASVRNALEAAALPLRCSTQQLVQWVTRHRKREQVTKSKAPQCLQDLVIACKSMPTGLAALQRSEVHELVLLESPQIRSEEVFVPFSCRGMLETLRSLKQHRVALVLDAKYQLLNNTLAVATIGLLSRRKEPSRTTLKRAGERREQAWVLTTTMLPLVQAIMHAESGENFAQLYDLLCRTATQLYHVDLPSVVLQVHKDYAPGPAL